jgi:chromosome segregation ATPase
LLQATHAKDLASKSKHLNTLTDSIKELNEEKRRQFELLQSRQEEIETATAAKEVSEARLKEIALEAKEAQERATLAEDALADAQRRLSDAQANQRAVSQSTAGNDSAASLAKARDQAEARLKDLKYEVTKLERERIDMEEEHGRQLRSQRSEMERFRGLLSDKEKEAAAIASDMKDALDRVRVLEREKETLSMDLDDIAATLRTTREAQAKASDGEVRVVSIPAPDPKFSDETQCDSGRPRSNRRLISSAKRSRDCLARLKTQSKWSYRPRQPTGYVRGYKKSAKDG